MFQAKLTQISAIYPLLAAMILMAVGFGERVVGQEVPDTTRVTISGTIYDARSMGPVREANLRFAGTSVTAAANAAGEFSLGGLLTGTYLLVVAAPGYQELRVNLQVVRTGSLNIPLEPVGGDGGPVRTNRVIGRVREVESGRPMMGAEVTLSGVRTFQVTGSDGKFEFPEVPQGFTTLTISHMGRTPMTDELEVEGTETLELDVLLSPEPVELDSMVVTVTRRNSYLEDMGFYDRIEKGYSGQQIDRDFIEERGSRSMGDIFQGIPGVRVSYDGLGRFQVLMARAVRFSSGDGCSPRLLIDDLPSDIGWLQDLQPQRVEAIEIYGGANAPLRYNDSCGVILVWTRRGDRGGMGPL
jgi:hypothetical protein